jgi:hypothetical protein
MSTVKAANLQNTGSGAPTFKNSSGTEIGQLAKSWVNFDGTGTVSIKDSFNVSSITDNGSGDYTITFTNATANANYAIIGIIRGQSSNARGASGVHVHTSTDPTTTAFRVQTLFNASPNSNGGLDDFSRVYFVVFGA